MSKNSSATTNQVENQAEWVDVSHHADTPAAAPGTAERDHVAERDHAAEPPVWWLYLRMALCVLAVVWVTEWVTTRRMIAERPPLRIDAIATLAPPRTGAQVVPTISEKATPVAAKLVVHIIGAVKKPGVYEVGPRARLRDAVQLAGGPLSDGDLESVNLAEFLADGQQYAIPQRNANAPATVEISSARTSRSARLENDAPKATVKAAPRAPKNAPPSAPIDLNSATAIELDTLPDIGPAKAARIIEYRAQNGGFKSVEDLVEVEGIGDKTLEKLRPYVLVR